MMNLSNIYIAEKMRKFTSAEHEMKVAQSSLHKDIKIRKNLNRI